jgi:hypothetical protein
MMVMISVILIQRNFYYFYQHFQVNFDFQHRAGIAPYYNSVFNSTTDFCSFMKNEGHPIANFILDFIKDTVPRNLFHPCPFSGEFIAYNVTIKPVALFSQFLRGRLRAILTFFDDVDENIFTTKHEVELS